MGPDPVRWQRVEASEASAARSTVQIGGTCACITGRTMSESELSCTRGVFELMVSP